MAKVVANAEESATSPEAVSSRTVLAIAAYFPPGTSSGTMRTVKFAKYLPELGWTPLVMTMSPEAYHPLRRDESLIEGLDPKLRVFRTPVWMPDRTIAGWLRKLKKPNSSVAKDQSGNSSGTWQKKRHRRWLVDDLLDWMHFPDDYGGWLIPGILEGRKIIQRESVDVIYSSAPSTVAHLIGMGLKRLTGLPWIADFRDPWEALFPECVYLEQENRWKQRAEVAIAERAVTAADLVIANTDFACEAFRERFPNLPGEKFVTLPNGFDPEDFTDLNPSRCEGEKFTLTYTGTFFTDLRTPDEVLSAVTELVQEGLVDPDRFKLKFVGCGPFSSLATPTLEVIPRVGHKEALQVMAESDVLLLLQQSEKYRLQIPAKTYEYMAVPKWILTIAPEGSTARLVRRMPNGVVVGPNQKGALKAQILKFYQKFLKGALYPVPRDEKFVHSYTRREQTRVLAQWLEQVRQTASGRAL